MPRIQAERISDAEGNVRAHLRSYVTVERYMTSVQDYMPSVLQEDNGNVAQRAHQGLLHHLGHLAPRYVNGAEAMAMMESTRLMPAGVDSFDELLLGGLREMTVTEVTGETSSGKTQLCHMATITTAKRGEVVVYIDATNGFNAQRLQQLMALSKFDDSVDDAVALTHIRMVRCHDIHALLAVLDQLAQQAATMTDPASRPKLIVVDSISALLSPVIGATQHHQGNVLVAETGRMLKLVAEALQAAVMVTNHVVGVGGFGRNPGPPSASTAGWALLSAVNSAYKPALGEQWRGVPHVRLQLSRATAGGNDLVCVTLLSHPLRVPGIQAWIRVADQLVDAQKYG